MRRLSFAAVMGVCVACGGAGAAIEPAASSGTAAPPIVAKGGDGGIEKVRAPAALRELSLRVAPGRSVAYRVKTKAEQPGRKVEQDFILFLDGWSDGTVSVTRKTGEHERTAPSREVDEFLPLPEGAQATYSQKREGSKDDGEPDADVQFQRQVVPNGKEQISFRVEKRRSHTEDTSEGSGLFDVESMRYERLHIAKTTRRTFPRMKEPVKETRLDVEVLYDGDGSAARTKEREARRETMLKASREPAGSANPTADIAAVLSGQNQGSGIIEFLSRGHPELVWKAVLAQRTITDRVRALGFERSGVPDTVLADVKATLKKSPSHPVSWLVIGAHDKRLLAELHQIAARHEDEDAREAATERLKELKKSLIPLAKRIGMQKPSKRGGLDREYLFGDIDPDRDRAALFGHVLQELTSASEEERSMLTQALQNVAKTSLGEDVEAWRQYWDSHKAKPYDEWLLEALASDRSPMARGRAAEALGERPATDANRRALRAALEDKDPEVRLEAAAALAALKDDAAVRPLLRALPDDSLRWKAITALSFFSDTDFGLSGAGPGMGHSEDTTVALGRWLGWARQRGIEPGY